MQFEDAEAIEHIWTLVRTTARWSASCTASRHPGIVLFTLVNDDAARSRCVEGCRKLQMPGDPGARSGDRRAWPLSRPRRAAACRASSICSMREYFQRIDAMTFALAHDDGQSARGFNDADVILVGVSRTSKTPTCIYLANRGIKAANVPIVPGVPLPPELCTATRPLVVGLTNDPERLIQIRRNRLQHARTRTSTTDYADPEAVRERGAPGAPALRRASLAGDRRHPPLDRGDRGGDPPSCSTRRQRRATA